MRRIITTLSLFAMLLTVISLRPATVNAIPSLDPVNPGTTNLISWWSLNETSGTRNDSHSANHLTDNNTVGYAEGKKGNAGEFVETNTEFLSISDNASLSPSQITICGWYYLFTKTSNRGLVSKWDNVATDRSFLLRYDQALDKFHFTVRTNGGVDLVVVAHNYTPSVNTWYSICAWYDGTSAYISINDTLPESASAASGALVDSAQPFYIGRARPGGPLHDGRIDEVFVYSRVLTSDERTWLYNSGAGREYCEVANNCPTPTPTITNTPTFTPTNTSTFTPTNTPTDTPTPSITNTFTPGPTATFTDTPTFTPTSTATDTPTPTNTATVTLTNTPYTPVVPTWFIEPQITYGEYMLNVSLLALCGVVILVFFVLFVILVSRRKRV